MDTSSCTFFICYPTTNTSTTSIFLPPNIPTYLYTYQLPLKCFMICSRITSVPTLTSFKQICFKLECFWLTWWWKAHFKGFTGSERRECYLMRLNLPRICVRLNKSQSIIPKLFIFCKTFFRQCHRTDGHSKRRTIILMSWKRKLISHVV